MLGGTYRCPKHSIKYQEQYKCVRLTTITDAHAHTHTQQVRERERQEKQRRFRKLQ